MLQTIAGFFLLIGSMLGINEPQALGGGSGTITQLNPWTVTGGTIKTASSTATLRVPFLASCDTIDTNADGVFACGTDSAGASTFPFTTESTWMATSTLLNLKGGVMSTASSTFQTLHAGVIDALTLDTGFGANELYDMNQHVQTTDDVTFRGLNFTNATGTSIYASASSTMQILNAGTLTVPSLTSALMLTNGSGVFAEYAGTSCTNQFPRSLSALGAATCASVATTDFASANVSQWTNDAGYQTYTWPFPLNATSTLLSFTGGIISTASSTLQNFNSASSTLGILLTTATTTHTGNTIMSGLSYNVSSSTASASQTVDWTSTTEWYYTMNQNTTFVLNSTSSRPLSGGRYILNICQDTTGSHTVTFQPQNSFNWTLPTGAGATTTFATTANTCSKIGFFYNATYSKYNAVASSTSMVNR